MTDERTLNIIQQNDFKWKKNVKPMKTVNRVLGIINRSFTCLSEEFTLPLYKALLKHFLEYSIQT